MASTQTALPGRPTRIFAVLVLIFRNTELALPGQIMLGAAPQRIHCHRPHYPLIQRPH